MTDAVLSEYRYQEQKAPFALYIALFFLLICINSLVAKFMVFSFPISPGVSSFYIVVVCMIVFSLWFGLWGAMAAYIGCFIGAGLLSNIPMDVCIYWSFADFFEAIIPLLAFRILHANLLIVSWRDAGIFLVFGVILNNFIGAMVGSISLAFGGIISSSEIYPAFFGWLFGNWIVCILLIPPVLRLITPVLSDHGLFVKNYLT